MTTTNWQELAKEAEAADGYIPGNQWERMLARHLSQCFPDLVKDLGNDLQAYTRAQTFDAMEFAARLEAQGTSPQTARELAMERLLPVPADEQRTTAPWELESETASEAAAMPALLKNLSEKNPPRTIQLT